MARRDYVKDITYFLQEAYNTIENGFDGCMYKELEVSGIYLVVAAGDEEGVVAKLAYNCDDLQEDYNWDWNQFIIASTGEVYDTDTILDKDNLERDAAWFYEQFKNIFIGLETGEIIA